VGALCFIFLSLRFGFLQFGAIVSGKRDPIRKIGSGVKHSRTEPIVEHLAEELEEEFKEEFEEEFKEEHKEELMKEQKLEDLLNF